MIIGIDADGVLTDMQEFNYKCGEKFFKKEIVNPAGYHVRDIFGVSKMHEFFYGLFYFPKYCKKYPPRDGAVDTINKLKQEGHVIHEITARKFASYNNYLGRKSKEWFVKWCTRNGFEFSSITFCSEKYGPKDKYDACKRLMVDLMVDDRPEIVLYLAERGVQVLMMDAPYNQDVYHKNIVRCFGWNEVYECIKTKEKKGM